MPFSTSKDLPDPGIESMSLMSPALQMVGLGRTPGEGNSYPLQYSGLENYMDRGAWRATVHGIAKNPTQLSNFHFRGRPAKQDRGWGWAGEGHLGQQGRGLAGRLEVWLYWSCI